MDDEAALIARHVATAAAAWFNAPSDVDAYRRLAEAVDEWNSYLAPRSRQCQMSCSTTPEANLHQ